MTCIAVAAFAASVPRFLAYTMSAFHRAQPRPRAHVAGSRASRARNASRWNPTGCSSAASIRRADLLPVHPIHPGNGGHASQTAFRRPRR
jgi:hypothetical protein